MELYTGQFKDYNFNNYHKKRQHRKGKNVKKFYDDIFTFDIETTSAWINEHGNIIKYKKGKSSDYWNSLQPLSICYIFMFGVNDKVYYGRTLEDFYKLLDDLPKDGKIIIWVHNLSWEAHFLFNILHDVKMFCRTPHRPMKLTCSDFENIEFRCSYMLTRLSLANWGKSLGVKKLTGDLDYNKIRTPKTKLTAKEMGYCERDCIVVYEGIKNYLKTYPRQEDIPLTQTGTVRRVVKDKLMCDEDYNKFIKTLVPKNANEYKMLQHVFAGGYTHANRKYSGRVLKAPAGEILGEHYDFTSDYPFQLCARKYPFTPWAYIPNKEIPSEDTFEDVAYIMELKFTGLRCETYNSYIQVVKCTLDSKITASDNGRVLEAPELTITITEQDWLIIKNMYSWESLEVLRIYKSYKQYLPKPFIEYVLELYGNKTSLKDLDDSVSIELYKKSKEHINALFGMTVTALLQADVEFNNNTLEWTIDHLTEERINEHLDKLRNYNKREKRYFLSYSWGIYCTAYARASLFMCLLGGDLLKTTVENTSQFYKDDIELYADTDSLFLLGHHDFTWYNNWCDKQLKKMCEFHKIDFNRTRPKTKKGKEKPLGHFLREDDITEFCTLGAKRYCERRPDGKLYLTVSGINKEAVYLLKNDISNFKDGFNFDKDFPTVTKKLPIYISNMPAVIYPDGYKANYKSGIALRPNGYKMTIDDKYKKLIKYAEMEAGDLPENFINSMRGKWV